MYCCNDPIVATYDVPELLHIDLVNDVPFFFCSKQNYPPLVLHCFFFYFVRLTEPGARCNFNAFIHRKLLRSPINPRLVNKIRLAEFFIYRMLERRIMLEANALLVNLSEPSQRSSLNHLSREGRTSSRNSPPCPALSNSTMSV